MGRRDVKDRDEDLTREPEMVKAYRDTWTLGVHSYLSYLRDRLLLCKELLSDTGSIFVQMGEENLQIVTSLLDEIFGLQNRCRIVPYVTTSYQDDNILGNVVNYLLWYARDKEKVTARIRTLFKSKEVGEVEAKEYKWLLLTDGQLRSMTENEYFGLRKLPQGARPFRYGPLTSQGFSEKGSKPFCFQSRLYDCGPNQHWKTNYEGLRRLERANYLVPRDKSISYFLFLEDFPVTPLSNLWTDTKWGFDAREKAYVVQTNTKIIERCIQLTTGPGDLVLDPTCGSGTTAYVAEQWGRRWITIDVSRMAMAIARQRLLTAKFDYYKLRPINAEDSVRNPDGVWLSERSAGVPPAIQAAIKTPFLNPFDEIAMHKHYLPHWQQGEVYYFLTWRLADALPKQKLEEWTKQKKAWLAGHPQPWDEKATNEFHERFSAVMDRWLDAGEGSCLLKTPAYAQNVANALRHFDGERYDLDSFVIMPNHVHVLFRMREPFRIEEVVHSWKSFTAKEINRSAKRSGTLWQEDYWDRMIRNEEHLRACRDYIRDNPKRGRLKGGEYVVYIDSDINGGQDARPPFKDGQDVGSPFKYTFDCKTVPHITLKSIAQNQALDPIFGKWEPILVEKLRSLNQALAKTVTSDLRQTLLYKLQRKIKTEGKKSVTDADERRWNLPERAWKEWEVPFDTDPDWPEDLKMALTDYRQAWRQKMDEVNACIAARADQEELVDQPYIDRSRVRVAGPFTIEGVIPAEESIDDAEAEESPIIGAPEELKTFSEAENPIESESKNSETYIDRMIRLLREDGVRFPNNKVLKFNTLEALSDGSILHAKGTWGEDSDERQVAILLGPQYGPLTTNMVEDAIRVAARRGLDDLVFAGFSFTGEAQVTIQEVQDPDLKLHMAQIRPDVNMGDLLKTTVSSQLFTVSGSPRTRVEEQKGGQYVVHMEGVDIYDPVTNSVRSTGAEKVAAWFLDSDYDGRCFCVCQAFFPDKNAWEKLGKALGTRLDSDALARFSGTVSLPFPTGPHQRIAIKVIDPRGNEVMRVHRMGGEYD